MNRIEELKKEAQKLIDCGDSREIAKGRGMMQSIRELEKYFHGFIEYRRHFDKLPLEAQQEIADRIVELEIER